MLPHPHGAQQIACRLSRSFFAVSTNPMNQYNLRGPEHDDKQIELRSGTKLAPSPQKTKADDENGDDDDNDDDFDGDDDDDDDDGRDNGPAAVATAAASSGGDYGDDYDDGRWLQCLYNYMTLVLQQ